MATKTIPKTTSTTFKRKAKKKPISDKRETIESLHKKKIEYFEELQKSLPSKQIELENLKKKFSSKNTTPSEQWNLKQKINDLQKEIKKIITREEETTYWVNNHMILVDYYTDQNTSSNKDTEEPEEKLTLSNTKKSSLADLVVVNKKNNKAQLLKDYVKINDPFNLTYVPETKPKIDETCPECNSYDLIHDIEGIICSECGLLIDRNSDLQKAPGYKELQDIDVQPQFSYKRINHFREWLNQIQGLENTDIPEQVLIDLRAEVEKNKMSIKKLNKSKTREFLKKLGHNKYYEHIPFIINSLNGIEPVKMSQRIEEEMNTMFEEIQIPFEKHKPPTRKNFLSYAYTLHKFCQLRGYDEFLPSFPLLKSRDKLLEQDKIWKKICHDLRWEYIPSL